MPPLGPADRRAVPACHGDRDGWSRAELLSPPRRAVRRLVAIPCLLVCAALAGAVTETSAQAPDAFQQGITDSLVTRGKRVYEGAARCAACHGRDGRGTVDGPDLTDPKWLYGKGDFEAILHQLHQGTSRRDAKTGKPMPVGGWEPVSEADARAVAAYVWVLGGKRRP